MNSPMTFDAALHKFCIEWQAEAVARGTRGANFEG